MAVDLFHVSNDQVKLFFLDEYFFPLDDQSLTPLPGETLDIYHKDQGSTKVVSEPLGNNCQQTITANTDSE